MTTSTQPSFCSFSSEVALIKILYLWHVDVDINMIKNQVKIDNFLITFFPERQVIDKVACLDFQFDRVLWIYRDNNLANMSQ